MSIVFRTPSDPQAITAAQEAELKHVANGGRTFISGGLRDAAKAAVGEIAYLKGVRRILLGEQATAEQERDRLTKQLTDEIEVRAANHERLKIAEEAAARLTDERDNLLEKVESLQGQAKKLTAEVEKSERRKKQRDGLSVELEKLRKQYTGLALKEKERQETAKQLDESKKEILLLRAQVELAVKERDDATREKSRFAEQAEGQARRAETAELAVATISGFLNKASSFVSSVANPTPPQTPSPPATLRLWGDRQVSNFNLVGDDVANTLCAEQEGAVVEGNPV